MGKRKASIYDIAKAVGVSPAAVSYVINNKKKVSDQTRKKILLAMKEMGYVVDHAAVSLSRGKSSIIGVCFPLESASDVFSDNPFYSEFLASFEKECSAHGHDVIIGYLKDPVDFENWLISRSLDGLVMFGLYSPEVFNIIYSHHVPLVLTDVYDQTIASQSIRVDDVKGGYLAGKYLLELGHRHIAFVGGALSKSKVDAKRLQGLTNALAEKEKDCALTIETSTNFQGGYLAANEVALHKDITAVFCGSDIVAIGLMRRLQELNYSIPNDISVIGFDDLKECTYVYPALTTIRQDISLKGKLAAEALFDRGKKGHEEDAVVVEPTLVVRNSTKSII